MTAPHLERVVGPEDSGVGEGSEGRPSNRELNQHNPCVVYYLSCVVVLKRERGKAVKHRTMAVRARVCARVCACVCG